MDSVQGEAINKEISAMRWRLSAIRATRPFVAPERETLLFALGPVRLVRLGSSDYGSAATVNKIHNLFDSYVNRVYNAAWTNKKQSKCLGERPSKPPKPWDTNPATPSICGLKFSRNPSRIA